ITWTSFLGVSTFVTVLLGVTVLVTVFLGVTLFVIFIFPISLAPLPADDFLAVLLEALLAEPLLVAVASIFLFSCWILLLWLLALASSSSSVLFIDLTFLFNKFLNFLTSSCTSLKEEPIFLVFAYCDLDLGTMSFNELLAAVILFEIFLFIDANFFSFVSEPEIFLIKRPSAAFTLDSISLPESSTLLVTFESILLISVSKSLTFSLTKEFISTIFEAMLALVEFWISISALNLWMLSLRSFILLLSWNTRSSIEANIVLKLTRLRFIVATSVLTRLNDSIV